MAEIHHPHDKFIKASLSNKTVSREFFERLLPDNIKQLVNLEYLHLENSSFLDDDMKASTCDLLFSTKFEKRHGYLYLLVENQIKPDPIMTLRMWEYILRIWRKYRKEHPNEPLPIVYPLLFYAGDKPYNEPIDLIAMFAEQDQAIARNILYSPFQLIDITQSSSSDFEKYKRLDSVVTALRSWRNLESNLNRLANLLSDIIDSGETELGDTIITYVTNGGTFVPHDEFMAKLDQALSDDKGQTMQSFSEYFTNKGRIEGEQLGIQKGEQLGIQKGEQLGIQKGEQLGIQKGEQLGIQKGEQLGIQKCRQEMVISMLNNGISIDLVAKSSGLSHENIENLYTQHKHDSGDN